MASNRNSNGTFKKGSHWRSPKPHWDREWLRVKYCDEKKSADEIASICGCKANNILYWLEKHGIARRTISETRKNKYWSATGPDNPMFGRCGDLNPNWKGGITPERQVQYARAMWRAIQEAVFERDSHKCRRCGCEPKGPKQKHTHHIKSWGKHPSLRFSIQNIVTLCRDCHHFVHSKGNTKREFLG